MPPKEVKNAGAGGVAERLWTFFWMIVNLVSSPCLIWSNKWLFGKLHFNYACVVTASHFLVTGVGLATFSLLGVFEARYLSLATILPLVLANAFCTPLSNLSMQFNSVGVYQIMKILITPSLVLTEYLMFGKVLPRKLCYALIPVCVGAAISTVTDFDFNVLGTSLALLSVVATIALQMYFDKIKNSESLETVQILLFVMPWSSLFLALSCPLFDDVFTSSRDDTVPLIEFEWTFFCVQLLLLSCALAFLVNISGFMIIGRTSPVTYNVVVHAKTVLTIAGGIFLFATKPVTTINLVGMTVTVLGIIYYTKLKMDMTEAPKKDEKDKK
eukprot:gnl/Spiro4/17759_TR9447_c0_g1_i1.p1 gnl/Spiro4/17759_TR9447_c0_g1~~gnl/Spiro4/17759_TR9447_c0_g1_i1.p1  ORF type:complete len:328 (+),score=87.04 gnl/Spiro4/17759_TR9447_c0_g1_i1:118-1101(+)